MNYPLHTRLFEGAYRRVVRPLFFRVDPELVHDRTVRLGRMLGYFNLTRRMVRAFFNFQDRRLEQTVAGMRFDNPVGLAAGFDKNAQLINILPDVGFGFAEVGSITGKPCIGNAKPRLWRVPELESLVVYYGLKNDGADLISSRLRGKRFKIPIGISAAKTNDKDTSDTQAAIDDYAHVVEQFRGIGDYLTVNISCPNTFGGEPFTDPKLLDGLLTRIDAISDKPVFLKLAVDLTHDELDAILEVVDRHNITGLVCSNLTKDRERLGLNGQTIPGRGGISGRAVQGLSDEQIRYVYGKTKGRYVIIGVGGIFTAEDAYRKIRLGASLVQLITSMIYRGPQVIGQINRGLAVLLERDRFSSVAEAVGIDNRVSS